MGGRFCTSVYVLYAGAEEFNYAWIEVTRYLLNLKQRYMMLGCVNEKWMYLIETKRKDFFGRCLYACSTWYIHDLCTKKTRKKEKKKVEN